MGEGGRIWHAWLLGLPDNQTSLPSCLWELRSLAFLPLTNPHLGQVHI